MTPIKKGLLVTGLALGGVAAATMPPRLDYMPAEIDNADIASLAADTRANLTPGTEKRLLWNGAEIKTEWSVVALHGFSASRQETAPLAERVAQQLGANLFETRFAGHGLKANGLTNVTAEEWLDDVAEAVTIGQAIGEKVVVIAVSNGAALTMSMLEYPAMQSVDALILVSPNFGPSDPGSEWITRPFGPLLLRLLAGPTRSWEALNEQQEEFWTTSYPSETIVQVMRVVDRANKILRKTEAPRTQVLYSPKDRVISIDALLSAYDAIQAPQKEKFEVMETGSPYNHMIAGDIISPLNTDPLAARISAFILRQVP